MLQHESLIGLSFWVIFEAEYRDKNSLQKIDSLLNLLKSVDLPNEDFLGVCKELLDIVDPLHHGVGLYNPVHKPKPLVRGWIEAGPDIQKPNSPNQLV